MSKLSLDDALKKACELMEKVQQNPSIENLGELQNFRTLLQLQYAEEAADDVHVLDSGVPIASILYVVTVFLSRVKTRMFEQAEIHR